MKIGDLVKYAPYHKELQPLNGLVIRFHKDNERVEVFWNRIRNYDEAIEWDWMADLEVINV